MRVLVSGSTGLIGSAVIPALVAANHEPIRLVRKRVPDDVPVRFWDPSEHSITDDALDGIGEDNRRGKRTNNDTTCLVTPKGSADDGKRVVLPQVLSIY